jgi:hypothetical protein
VKADISELCNNLDAKLGVFVMSFDMCKYSS